MNATSRTDRKSGDARVAGISRSPLLRLPIRLNFLGQEENQELLLPAASDCAWVRAIAKDQRGRLDEERLAGFNQSADPSTYRRKNSVRTTRATAKALPVIVDCFNQHPSDKLRGRTAAIHNMLQPRLSEALGGLPLYLTIGWIELDGTPRVQHGEERIRMFLTEKWAAWQREGCRSICGSPHPLLRCSISRSP
jgi:hypothetical protein